MMRHMERELLFEMPSDERNGLQVFRETEGDRNWLVLRVVVDSFGHDVEFSAAMGLSVGHLIAAAAADLCLEKLTDTRDPKAAGRLKAIGSQARPN